MTEQKPVAAHSVASTMSQAKASIVTSQTGAPQAADAAEIPVPRNFGRYTIEKELGKGAMGVVYLAEDTQLGRKVALKIPKKSILQEPDALERFYREAKTTSQIRHPNICPVHDVGDIDGVHYLTMAYIPGKPVSSFVSKDKFPAAKQVALLIRKIALALEEAHRQGVVHRDLKPSNVILDDRGEPIVMDFGLARNTNTVENARLTQSGEILGTPAYMAPEQVSGETDQIGPRSDIYALGVMLYQFLTGELPFDGPIMLVFAKIIANPPKRPSALRPDVDPTLEAICLKMMAKDAGQRYASMQAVAAALTEYLKTGAVAGLPTLQPKATDTYSPGATLKSTASTVVNLDEQLAELAELVEQLLIRDDYLEAIRIVEDIPDYQRTPELRKLLGEAYELKGVVEKLERNLEQYLNQLDIPALTKCVTQLLKLRPSHPRGKEIRKALKDGGKPGVIKLLKKTGDYHGGALAWEWWQIGAAAGSIAGLVAVVSFALFIYLRSATGVLEIKVDDPTAVVKVDGKTVTLDGAGLGTVRVTYGDRKYIVERGGETVIADGHYEMKRDGKNELVITLHKPKPGDGVAGTNVPVVQSPDQPLAKAETPKPGPKPADPNAPPLALAPFDGAQTKAHQEAWAKHLGVPVEWTNSLGMKFVLIPPGEFLMGSSEDDREKGEKMIPAWRKIYAANEQKHRVRISQPLYLGQHEVTKDQFAQFAKATGYQTEAEKNVEKKESWRDDGFPQTDNHPVVIVTWNDAVKFCEWLSEQQGTRYELPTDAQWEYACRAGTQTLYQTGDSPGSLEGAANGRDESSTMKLSEAYEKKYPKFSFNDKYSNTAPVGRFQANPFGLFDMHGNVWEWCRDVFDQKAYEKRIDTTSDPFVNAGTDIHVLRGGSFMDGPAMLRSALRWGLPPGGQGRHIGFRVKLSVDGARQASKPPANTGWHGWPADAPKPAIAPFDAVQAKQHQEAWAAYLKAPVEYTNSVGMKFRLIPPGEFLMGSTPEEIEAAFKDLDPFKTNQYYKLWQGSIESEAPQRKVILTQPIYVGVHEVTQGQYKKVMGTNPSFFAKSGPIPPVAQKVAGMDTTNHPVENVSWNDATEFCAKLSQQETLKPFYERTGEVVKPVDGTGYRLPSDAEWEFSYRAGTTTRYWFGDNGAEAVQMGWISTNSGDRTHAVGELKSNPFGLYDMLGNLNEMAQDGWDPSFYYQFREKPAINPNAPYLTGSPRVVRSGNFSVPTATWCRSSARSPISPTFRSPLYGFRVSLTVDAAKGAPETSQAAPPPSKPADPNADRTAAEWVLSLGGGFGIAGKPDLIRTKAGLPSDAFQMSGFELKNQKFSRADIARFEGLENFTWISLDGCQVETGAIAGLKTLPRLNRLDITRGGLTNERLSELNELPNLIFLILSNNPKITDVGEVQWQNFFQLQFLALDNTGISNAALAKFSGLTNLSVLMLYSTKVSSPGMKHLSSLQSLQTLNLTDTKIDDDGVKEISKLANLKWIVLDGTRVGDAGANHLLQCKQLNRIQLNRTRVSSKGFDSLRKAFPTAEITWTTFTKKVFFQ